MKNQLLLLLLVALSCACQPAEQEAEPSKNAPPNIIYILADDLGYGDLNIYNPDSKIPTPHIDQLAMDGMRFTDAHSPSSVCTPTRYGILTGEYCWRSRLPQGVLRGYGRSLIETNQMTVASFLKEQGYSTGVVGKWHLGLDWVIKEGHTQALESDETAMNEVGMITEMNPEHIDFTKKPTDGPLNHGFDYSFILPASLDMDPYCYLENDSLTAIPSEYTPGNDLNTGYTEAFWRAGKIAPGFDFDQVLPTFTRKSIQFIEEQTQTDQPFFLYVPFAAPHTPWVPTSEFNAKAEAGTYGDFVTMVDHAVGQILQTLTSKGLAENTLVIFTSDNGPFWTPTLVQKHQHKAVGPLRGMKADAWEGGHRIPFIVRWPEKVASGSTSNALTTLTNLMATAIDLVGVDFEINPVPDSHSILPILLGEKELSQEVAIHHSSRGVFAVRKGPWKLILGRGSGGFSEPRVYDPKEDEVPGQLYNLNADLAEENNIYKDFPEKVEELTTIFREIQSLE